MIEPKSAPRDARFTCCRSQTHHQSEDTTIDTAPLSIFSGRVFGLNSIYRGKEVGDTIRAIFEFVLVNVPADGTTT